MYRCVILLLFIGVVSTKYLDSTCAVKGIETWSDQPSLRTEPLNLPVDLVVIQHTVTQNCYTDEECEDIVRRIRSYHIERLGWTDIGYSFLVGGNGVVYEGAGWKVGAHTLGYNNRSIGISFVGDFRSQLPTEKALQAAEHMLECHVKQKRLTEDFDLVAHSQLANTLSPGAKLAEEIRKWPHWVEKLNV